MSSLPPELVGQILTSVDVPSLHLCCLVNRGFHASAQNLLFSHLHLSGYVKLAITLSRCDFFLADENHRLSRQIKKLSIGVDRLPIRRDDKVPAQLIALLVKIGPQLDTFCMNGLSSGDQGYLIPFQFNDISPLFYECLLQHVMPSLRSLELCEVANLPIFPIIRGGPRLRHLDIGASSIGLSPLSAEDENFSFLSGELTSLSIGSFSESDFHPKTSLARFLGCSNGLITSLRLWNDFRQIKSVSLQFLLPFSTLTSHLRYLTLGLEMLSCSIVFAGYAARWFNWVTNCLKSTLVASPVAPIALKRLRFSVMPSGEGTVRNTLDLLGDNAAFGVSLEFTVSAAVEMEMTQRIFHYLRSSFPTWDEAERLNLWVEY
ncbi:hypothetical protein DL96DRAFT_208073 [Flagelloscypha sp. PMI_526]|nr:hypothetical protein DL96DRAFT_208073 [Flagelloscypha sp. PMI_526]